MSGNDPADYSASKMMRREIHAVIDRYTKEATISYYQVIGCLEVVKTDIIESMEDLPEEDK